MLRLILWRRKLLLLQSEHNCVQLGPMHAQVYVRRWSFQEQRYSSKLPDDNISDLAWCYSGVADHNVLAIDVAPEEPLAGVSVISIDILRTESMDDSMHACAIMIRSQ